jgi:uncharacterized RDD family membrane protein YckC
VTLMEQFQRVEDEYFRLKGQLSAGRIDQQQFDQALQDLMVQHEGRWWLMGAQTGKWYCHDGANWVEADPPLAAGGMVARQEERRVDTAPPVDRTAGREPVVAPAGSSTSGTIASSGFGAVGTLNRPSLAAGNYSSFRRRLLGWVVDSIILTVLAMIIPGLSPLSLASYGTAVAAITYWLLSSLYYVPFWAWRGQTPGKMLVGIVIVDAQGGKLGPRRAIIRYATNFLSQFCFLLGYLWVIWDNKKQAWHDKVAGTYVVRK